ncbi:condensin-2 complex subunit H2-like [Babylonia areolata]|uniref:condensin-2 complex subunit H2-like n=1 Tax=Babylonia areolata TaxID=304850 RepID=UPI003FD1DFB7
MITSSQTADLEARFGHLLQPIRDLTKNWDIDIARHLEEYLGDLESVAVTFNCGETTMNFAEAALLIQGSACVYSKKVEYLYSLAYQVLDMIVNKKKQQKASSVDAEGNDADADFPEEDKEEFLSLDDTKAASKEKLQNREDPDKECHVHPQTPMNLIAQEDGEKEAAEINNNKGEVLGHLSDFQMNCSTLQPQGGVFLDSNLLPLLHSRLRLLASSTPFPKHERAPMEKSIQEEAREADLPPPPPPDDVSMDDGGFEPLEAPGPEDTQPPQEESLPRRSERKKVQFAVPKPKPVVDHWALKDPYSPGKLAEKPLRKGQTFRVPTGLQVTAGGKKRKRAAKEKKTTADVPIWEFVQMRVFSHRPKFPKNPCLVPSFPEFDDMFWKEFKRRQEKKRQKQKQQIMQEVYEPEEDCGVEVEDNNWPAAVDDDGDAEGDHFEPLELQLDDNVFAPIEACGGEFINSLGSSGSTGSTYEDVVRQHVENFLAQAAKFAQISELSKRVAEWEEKINPRLQEEEQRESFDIHKYGSNVIEGMQRNQKTSFRRIVSGKPIFQICRLFLATLQLANNYNVELSCPGTLEEGMDRLEVQLLSTKRHYEELADYQAPSLANTQ